MIRNGLFALCILVHTIFTCYSAEQKDSAPYKEKTLQQSYTITGIYEHSGALGQGFQAYLSDGTKMNVYQFTAGSMAGKFLCNHAVKCQKGVYTQSIIYTTGEAAHQIFTECKNLYENQPKKRAGPFRHGLAFAELHLTLMKQE